MNLQQFTKKLIASGFRVFHNPTKPTYLFVVNDNGQIGYVQEDENFGHLYITVHKPNTRCGTGFLYHFGELNIEIMKGCCNCYAPEWGKHYLKTVKEWNLKAVEKWKLSHWISKNPHLVEIV